MRVGVSNKTNLFLMTAVFAMLVIFSGCQLTPSAEENNTNVWFPENITLNDSTEGPPLDSGAAIDEKLSASEGADSGIQGLPSAGTPTTPATEEIITIIVNESELVKLSPRAISPEGLPIDYQYSYPLDAEGEWQTEIGDAGEYLVDIKASDGITTDSKKVLLIVRSLNKAPVMGKINDVVVYEGEEISFDPIVVDPDGDNVTISYSGFMQTESYVTKYGDAGEYFETITASDGRFSDTRRVKITVLKTNRPPVLKPILDVTVTEGDIIKLRPQAVDPDGQDIEYTFTEPLNSEGIWQTSIGDAGTYQVNVSATDGKLTDTKQIFIIVSRKNLAPVFVPMDNKMVAEGENLSFKIKAIDPDGDELTYSVFGLPLGARFDSKTQLFSWTPDYDTVSIEDEDQTYTVTFIVSDGLLTDSKPVSIVVSNVPRAIQIIDVKQG